MALLASQHLDWNTKEPFASVIKGDIKAALAGGEHAVGDGSDRLAYTTRVVICKKSFRCLKRI